ncbi:virulence factor family protein [Rhizobium sp. YIM 134829]|uniref:virulence factor family protein n=1 Tax=Rhizobium sp. YIM 134829 TaxID=3390453 RepID=UPI00397CC027
MKRLTLLTLLASLAVPLVPWVPATPAAAQDAAEYDTGMIPSPRILKPEGEVKSAVFLISDAAGWSAKEDGVAKRLTGEGALVIGIDLPSYLAKLAKDEGDCVYMVSDIESLSQQVQRSLDNSAYDLPVVAGVGAGGALALAIAAQTPPATIGGTIAADPEEGIALLNELCTPADKRTVGDRMIYGLTDGPLPDPVSVLFSDAATEAEKAHVQSLVAKHEDIDVEDAGSDVWASFSDALSDRITNVEEATNPLGLPLTLLEAPKPSETMAVVLSGDGGWRDIDKEVGDELAKQGISVVGLDSLRYFWSERKPQEVAKDLSRIMDFYSKRWKAKRVLLIGYSFGADLLPRTYNLLPASDRSRIGQISLLALSDQVDYQISVLGWIGAEQNSGSGSPVDDLKSIDPKLVQCIYGTDEEDDVCPTLRGTGVEIVPIEGGHHFDEDYPALVKRILASYAQRLKGEVPQSQPVPQSP